MTWQLDDSEGESLLKFIDGFNKLQEERSNFDSSFGELKVIIEDANEAQLRVNKGFNESLDRIEKKIVPEPIIKKLINDGIKDYDYDQIKKQLKKKELEEQSQQINIAQYPTPQNGNAAVDYKQPMHKNPYVVAPTVGGLGAIIYIAIDLILKYNGAG